MKLTLNYNQILVVFQAKFSNFVNYFHCNILYLIELLLF